MANIDSVLLPNGNAYNLQDNTPDNQKAELATPLTINGTQETTVEGALSGLNDYGDALTDNLAANEESGAKNLFIYPYSSIPSGGNGMTFTDVGNGPITISGIASADTFIYLEDPAKIYLKNGQYKLSGTPHFGDTVKLRLYLVYQDTSNNTIVINVDNNSATENTFTINGSYGDANGAACNAYIKIFNGADCSSTVTFYPMIRDARILDPTFAPFAKTNLQLTNDKAERDDLSTIHATGSTNTTGAQIDAGTFFYLNGQFCKALTNIAVNATFTLNTNFKVDSVGEEIKPVVAFKYGAVKSLSATIQTEIENSFTNAANYSMFSGSTSGDTEGGWYGFKHTDTKYCHMIFFDRSGIYAITRASDGTYTKNVIFENN